MLDHDDLAGVDLRPHLPDRHGHYTAEPSPEMLAAPATPLADLLEPLDLDPLTVPDDHRFLELLAKERNLPAQIATRSPTSTERIGMTTQHPKRSTTQDARTEDANLEGAPMVPESVVSAAEVAAGAAAARAAGTPDPIHEEVRVAMALNGGVSLAVWMGGVAVELDCARRAHLGIEAKDSQTSERQIYNGICGAFARSLVPDILSGASAGGLNGTLLAAVMRRGRRLPPNLIRSNWIKIGDFSKLLQPLSAQAPRSLMKGGSSTRDEGVFYRQLREIFEAILATPNASADDVSAFDPPAGQAVTPFDAQLDVTMTDVVGEPKLFLDVRGQPLAAREYRAPFHFRRPGDFTVENLATAARASASFPAAFEAFKVGSRAAALAGLSGARYAIDGGLLENAPIDAAIRLIPERTASCQVKRFVCYVNAAPPSAEAASDEPDQPDLAKVLGYVINVPRDARFVDQLYAVEAARRRAAVARSASENLFLLPYGSLVTVASGLLRTYALRRLRIALENLLEDTAAAESVFALVRDAPTVQWLPVSLEPPTTADEWRWGVRAAERLLHLQLDLLDLALPRPEDEHSEAEQLGYVQQRNAVLQTRLKVYACLARIEALRDATIATARFMIGTQGFEPLAALDAVDAAFRGPVFNAVTDATDAFVEVLPTHLLGDPHEPGTMASAFANDPETSVAEQSVAEAKAKGAEHQSTATSSDAPPKETEGPADADGAASAETMPAPAATEAPPRAGNGDSPESAETIATPALRFLRRALAIEVIRRAFSTEEDIEPGQQLLFAQLTPTVPAQIFTSQPFRKRGPASGEEKLTGIRLMHFAGFYRPSWRANDFLWGRLDGAARIVDLLVDGQRARQVIALGGAPPAPTLTNVLLPEGTAQSDPRAALIEEALHDAARPASGVPSSITTPASTDAASSNNQPQPAGLERATRPVDGLRTDLQTAIERDLTTHDGAFTRTILARAAQLEILRDELPELNKQTNADEKLGVHTKPLGLPADITDAIDAVRRTYASGNSLPLQLGRDNPDEATSDLALQTISRTLIVTLAALRGVNLSLGKLVAIARVPLLPITGMTSRRLIDWVGVTLGVAAATTYIAARLTTADPNGDAPLGALWSTPVILYWLAALAGLGVVLVPLIRAARTPSPRRRMSQGAVALALLAGAVVIPIVVSWRGGHLGFVQILATPGGIVLPAAITAGTLAIVFGAAPILRLSVVPAVIRGWLEPVIQKLSLTILIGAAGVFVATWSCWHLIHVIQTHGLGWQLWAIVSALAAIVIFPVYVIFSDHDWHRSNRRS